jgi:hypothetical protein
VYIHLTVQPCDVTPPLHPQALTGPLVSPCGPPWCSYVAQCPCSVHVHTQQHPQQYKHLQAHTKLQQTLGIPTSTAITLPPHLLQVLTGRLASPCGLPWSSCNYSVLPHYTLFYTPQSHVYVRKPTLCALSHCPSAGIDWTTGQPLWSSMVQLRGSVPLFWSQQATTLSPKPDIVLQQFDPAFEVRGRRRCCLLQRPDIMIPRV